MGGKGSPGDAELTHKLFRRGDFYASPPSRSARLSAERQSAQLIVGRSDRPRMRSPASRPRRSGRRPSDRVPRAFVRAAAPTGALARQQAGGGSLVSRGCRRADPNVRQAARMTMPAWGRTTNRCPAPLPAAGPNQSGRFGPAARPLRGGRRPCDRGPGGLSLFTAPMVDSRH
jgi:hypothetical protein